MMKRKMAKPNIGYYFGGALGLAAATGLLFLLAAVGVHLGIFALLVASVGSTGGAYLGHYILWRRQP